MARSPLVPTAIFASGNGSNLQAVVDAAAAGTLPIDVRLVVSDNPDAFALERARSAGIPAIAMAWDRAADSREAYGTRLAQAVHARGVRLVLLLGWMHVLARTFCDAGFDAILNLHPAYLPDDPDADEVALPDGTRSPVFRGARAVRDALAAGVKTIGATLIEITPEVDRGPVLARRTLALVAGDDEASALSRLHAVEREVVRDGILAWIARSAKAAAP